MSVTLFAYGTLQIPDIMEAVTGKCFPSEAAVLCDHESFLVRGHSYPGVVESPGARTTGRLFCGVDDSSLALLDRFEGYLYERRTAQVTSADGAELEAQIYVVPEKQRRYLSSQPWNVDHFLKEHFAAFRQSCRSFHLHEAGWVRAQEASRVAETN